MTLRLRDAEALDAGAAGAILGACFREYPWMPVLYSGAEEIAHVGNMIEMGWVRVATGTEDRGLRGFIAREAGYIHALYVARGARGHGVGRALMAEAMAACDRLELRTFEANLGARRFYRQLGFVEVERGDGRDNDEGLADVGLVWERRPGHQMTQGAQT